MKKNTVLLLLSISCGLLNGCEKNQPSQLTPAAANKKYDVTTTLHGAVGDNKGFAATGTIKATSTNNQVISTASLNNNKNYQIEIPANTALPIILTFSPESSDTKVENFVAVVTHPSITKYDINPMTTEIAKRAMSLGGYSDANMRQAAESMMSVPDRDKTTAGFRGDPTQHYGGWH
jgi:hypothetical protein